MFSSPSTPYRALTRLSVIAAVGLALVVTPVLTPPAHAHTPGTKITRTKVIKRAWTWVKRDIQYSQSGTAKDAEWAHRYRRDCSGYVSMTWHTKARGMNSPTTWTLPDRANRIYKKNLRRGDILVDPYNHVVLFHKWANTAHTRFWLFEQSNPSSDMNHRRAYLSSYKGFKAMRYKRIVNG